MHLISAAVLLQAVMGTAMHWRQGQYGLAFASLGVRLILPAAAAVGGASIGTELAPQGGNLKGFGPTLGAAIGFASGVLVAQVIDYLVLCPVGRAALDRERKVADAPLGVQVFPVVGDTLVGAALVASW